MTKEEYDRCIDDFYGVVNGNPDQMYSDFVSCVLDWQNAGIIDLEYLLDNFITGWDVNEHIREALDDTYLDQVSWIKDLNFYGDYFVINEDNSLRNITMQDIYKLEDEICKQLEDNVDTQEVTE